MSKWVNQPYTWEQLRGPSIVFTAGEYVFHGKIEWIAKIYRMRDDGEWWYYIRSEKPLPVFHILPMQDLEEAKLYVQTIAILTQ